MGELKLIRFNLGKSQLETTCIYYLYKQLNSSMNRLTIAIPTYNRCDLLDRLLLDINSEIKALSTVRKQLVDIWVIDNKSTDNTLEVIKKWRGKSNNFYYEINPANLGIEGNIIKASLISDNEYTWLLSDHQRIRPRVINEILDILEVENPSLIIMEIDQWRPSHKTMEKKSRFMHEISPDELGEIFFLTGNLSTNLFEKSLATRSARDAIRISYSYYPNMAKLSKLNSESIICRISSATALPQNSENSNLKRHYDTFIASFIEHISVTRKLINHELKIKWSIRGFQNSVYVSAMAFELCKILCLKSGDFKNTFITLIRAMIANRGRYILSICSLMTLLALIAYLLPISVRKRACIILLMKFKPNSSFLMLIKNV